MALLPTIDTSVKNNTITRCEEGDLSWKEPHFM